MTASDVRDIMQLPGIGGHSSVGSHTQAKKIHSKSKPTPKKRPDGITRELYALIGDSAPPLTMAGPSFKSRPRMRVKAKRWEWRSFHNLARKDGLQLAHWVKETDPRDEDYKFAKFNIHAEVYSYTDEEYDRLLANDPAWTRDETDYLLQIAREYDLRWIVIGDRWDWPVPKSIEEIKSRYYTICRRLIKARGEGEESARTALMMTYAFDPSRETARKQYLSSLFSRDPAQLAEEEALYIESRRLEQNERRMAKEREDLLRLLTVAEQGTILGQSTGNVGLDLTADTPTANIVTDVKKKKRVEGDSEPAITASSLSAVTSEALKKQKEREKERTDKEAAKNAAQDAILYIQRHDTKSRVTTGAHLRSTRLYLPKPALQQRVQSTLDSLGIPARLVMPTIRNVDTWDDLMRDVVAMLELKRLVDRSEQEYRIEKGRRDGTAAASADSSVGSGGADGTSTMDIIEFPPEEEQTPDTVKRSASQDHDDERALKRPA